jgi:hypothetical protein
VIDSTCIYKTHLERCQDDVIKKMPQAAYGWCLIADSVVPSWTTLSFSSNKFPIPLGRGSYTLHCKCR